MLRLLYPSYPEKNNVFIRKLHDPAMLTKGTIAEKTEDFCAANK
jgi:hypothetical protein